MTLLRRRTCSLALAIAALSVCPSVLADSAEEQAARTLFREGLSLYQAHDYDAAIQKYREAYARWKNPKILANLGTAAWEAGHYVEAAEAYDRFLDEAPANDPNRAEVVKARKEVIPKVGTLDVRIVGGTAAVTIDGKSIDTPHLDRIRVEPGSRTVEAVGAGGLRDMQAANVAAGATAVVELHLSAPMATAASPTPAVPPVEEHRTKLDLSTKTPLPWIAAGVGAAGFLTSAVVYFGLRAPAVSDLQHGCLGDVCPSSSQGAIDRANTFGLISAISLGVGVAGVGTGIVLFALDKKSGAPASGSRVTLSVAGGPDSARATARVHF